MGSNQEKMWQQMREVFDQAVCVSDVPIMTEWSVIIQRVVQSEAVVIVNAPTKEIAKALAQNQANVITLEVDYEHVATHYDITPTQQE